MAAPPCWLPLLWQRPRAPRMRIPPRGPPGGAVRVGAEGGEGAGRGEGKGGEEKGGEEKERGGEGRRREEGRREKRAGKESRAEQSPLQGSG